MKENLRQKASEKRRAAIVSAASEIFGKKGFNKACTEDIAVKARVSKGLIFHLFKTKQHLFQRTVEDSLAQWASFSEYRAFGNEGDEKSVLKDLFIASFDFVEQHPIIMMFSYSDEKMLLTYQDEINKSNKAWRNTISSIIKSGIESGSFRDDLNVKCAAVVFHETQVSMLQGIISEKFDRSVVHFAIDSFVRGIEA